MASEQVPSVGRIVLFHALESNGATEHSAIITRVWSNTCVNLLVFPDNGTPIAKTSACFDEAVPATLTCGWRWPPRV